MTHDTHHPIRSCADAAELVPDYLDGELPGAARAALAAHLATCDDCAALVADLESVRASAAALPRLSPERDLWAGIAERIEAPVVPLAVAPSARRRSALPWRAIAAGLVLMAGTAAVTYTVTARQHDDPAVAPAPVVASTAPAAPVPVAPAAPEPVAPPVAPAPEVPRGAPAASSGRRAPAAARPPAAAPPVALLAAAGAEGVYDGEIEALARLLDQRRGSLDSGTVAVLERNLAIIDQAIRESREALARDPSSRFLTDQLTGALDQKLQLMRTAVLLTSGT